MSIMKDFEQEAKMKEDMEHYQKLYKWSQQNNKNYSEIHKHMDNIYMQLSLIWSLNRDSAEDMKATEEILKELVEVEKAKEELRNRKIPRY